jgi:hypothetical protein
MSVCMAQACVRNLHRCFAPCRNVPRWERCTWSASLAPGVLVAAVERVSEEDTMRTCCGVCKMMCTCAVRNATRLTRAFTSASARFAPQVMKAVVLLMRLSDT